MFVLFGSKGLARSENGPVIDPTWLAKARIEGKASYEKYKALSLRWKSSASTARTRLPVQPVRFPSARTTGGSGLPVSAIT